MEVQAARTYFRLSQFPHNVGGGGGAPHPSPFFAASFSCAVFSPSLKKKNGSKSSSVSLRSSFMGVRSTEHEPTRRAPSLGASLLLDDHYFSNSGGDDEESARRSRLEREQERQASEAIDEGHTDAPLFFSSLFSSFFRKTEPTVIAPPAQPELSDWVGQIVPASVESSWCSPVHKAFSSMVFMIQGILNQAQQGMDSSFVCLFERIFFGTLEFLVSVMLFLADFTVFSFSHNPAAIPCTNASSSAESASTDQQEQQEANGMKASAMDESLTDPGILRSMAAPPPVVMETESGHYLQEEARYEEAINADPNNALLLANFAQFLYLFIRDHDRAELYFKKAAAGMSKAADPMALSWYATFLWRVRRDLEGAEAAYLEAISGDPSNSNYAADYCHFLWETGGADTCCYHHQDHPDLDSEL